MSGDAMHAGTAHRPWPVPPRPWALTMQWHGLLFMHWPVQPAMLCPLIPPPLEIDTFDSAAWIGVVPFHITGAHPHYVPALPWVSAFPEVNVRTYVTLDGKPGVWFFSLDAANPLAVRGARVAFHLPYYDARMMFARDNGMVRYTSRRIHRRAPPAEFAAQYRPTGPVFLAPDGSIDRWLTERYCLYAGNRRGTVWRGEIHHTRWRLQPAEVEIERNTMADPLRLALPARPPLLHFAERQDVVAWTLTVLRRPPRP